MTCHLFYLVANMPGKIEKLWQECQEKIPGVMLRNRSVTTNSIYCKTPDGYSLRIGDHKGREEWSYRWNLRADLSESYWKTECKRGKHIPRYYTSSVDDLAHEIAIRMHNLKSDMASTKEAMLKSSNILRIAVAALEEIEAGELWPEMIAASALKQIVKEDEYVYARKST
jgi:hypothetical protein